MNLLNSLINSQGMPWVITVLLVILVVRILMLVALVRILLKSSTLNKSQKQNLISFLEILNSSLKEITPNLLEASRTALSNKGLLNLQKVNPEQSQELAQAQEHPEQSQELAQAHLEEEASALDNFIDFIKAFKEVKK